MINRKHIVYLVIAFIVIITIFGFMFVNRTSVTVFTDDKNSIITITNLDNEKTKKAKSKATIKSPGRYSVLAKTNNSATAQYLEIKSKDRKEIKLDLKPTLSSNTITSFPAKDISQKNGDISFLHPDAGTIIIKNTQSALPSMFPVDLPLILNLIWADNNSGIIILRDGRMFGFNGDNVFDISLPPEFTTGVSTTPISLNKQGNMAIINKGDLYYYQNLKSKPQKIAESLSDDSLISLSPNGKLIGYFEQTVHETESVDNSFNSTEDKELEHDYDYIIFDSDGNKKTEYKTSSQASLSSLAWPHDDKIIFSRGSFIYSLGLNGQEQTLFAFPEGYFLEMKMLKNGEPIVSFGAEIWHVITEKKTAYMIYTTDDNSLIADSLYVDDGDNIYFGERVPSKYRAGFLKKIQTIN